jgi:uncharacterized membrane protein
MQEMQTQEMSALAAVLRSPTNSFVEKNLTKVSLPAIVEKMQESAPMLWNYLYDAAFSKQQRKRNTAKRPDKVSML